MATVTAPRRDTPVTVLAAVTAFGLLLGWATYTLHGTTPLLERATNSVSTWIIWTAAAGALIRTRGLAAWSGGLMMLATCAGYYTASALGTPSVPEGSVPPPSGRWPDWWEARCSDGAAGPCGTGRGRYGRRRERPSRWWCWGGPLDGADAALLGEAVVFLAVGALLTALLTVHLARAGERRFWWCAVLAPVFAVAFYLAELFVLDGLIGSF